MPEHAVVLNEIYASHTGVDDTEYVELFGRSGMMLDNISLIVVVSDAGSFNGRIDRRIDFTANDMIGSNGY